MDQELLDDVIHRVHQEFGASSAPKVQQSNSTQRAASGVNDTAGSTEFVGTSMGDTIGLVIAGVDPILKDFMKLGAFRSIGIIGARTGADSQIMAIDEAVKATNTEVISIELPRDTKGGAGHGCLIIIGAEDVSDARRAIEIALSVLPKYYGDCYSNEAGHLDFQYSARASYCLEKAFNAKFGKAFGFTCAAPAAIGVVLADIAVKTANVEVVSYLSPHHTNYTNEVILCFSGEADAVRQAVKAAIAAGKNLLGTLGSAPKSMTTPYI